MRLNKDMHELKGYKERILQFGEGNFLRAFVDWMIDECNKKADFQSGVVVVQPLEEGLVDKLNEQDGLYTLYLNGIKDGVAVREKFLIDSITRGINPYRDYDEYLKVSHNPDLRFVISNTTEAGIAFDERDKFEDKPQKSFPGKVTAFLYERFKHFNGAMDKGLIFIPCELIDKNGDNLKAIVLKYAELWGLGESFITWVKEANTFCNSLVDRIVPGYPKDRIDEITKELGYEDSLVVEGEQFHLWVIEGPEWVAEELPLDKIGLNVLFVKDLTPYRTRKVRILNGAHTAMVPVGLLSGLETVKETVEDKVVGKFVKKVIFDEIVPTLDLPEEELISFANDVLDRFRNPFIKHYLMSIALNSNSKFETRVLPSILEYNKRKGELPKGLLLSFAALIKLYRNQIDGKPLGLKDDKEILDLYEELWNKYDGSDSSLEYIVEQVLAQEGIWKMDLNKVEGLKEGVSKYLIKLMNSDIESVLKEVL